MTTPTPRLCLLRLVCLLPSFLCVPARAQDSLADVIERCERSVVRIEVTGRDGASIGSGFVVDDRGTIVTNCHVLAGATSATAIFPDGAKCEILGTRLIDPSRDIVVGNLSLQSRPPLEIASVEPRKGERVTALGAPHGLSFTATTGIVSAIRSAKEMSADVGRQDIAGLWIQVDAALSPGNSGGPLINSSGQIVAMSTLASQGSAQNLNFGISGRDISEAVRKAANQPLTNLSAGVGKIRMQESGSRGGEDDSHPQIPSKAFEEYIAAGTSNFKELTRGLRSESARMSNDLKDMRRGEEFMPNNLRAQGASVARVKIPGQRNPKWFFSSSAVKDAAIEKQSGRIRMLTNLKNEVSDPNDPEAMFSLLWNYGPELDARKIDSIGFAREMIVVHAFNQHDVLVSLDDAPYLLWMESTAGMGSGEILSGPVFVAGTATAELSRGVTSAVTVIAMVAERDLKAAISSASSGHATVAQNQPASVRTWNDRTGKFSVDAVLLGSDDTKVVLKKQDGSIINVPISALSDADRDFLNQ